MRTIIAAALAIMAVPVAAEPRSGSVVLPVSFAGLPVGKLEYTVTLDGQRYTIDGRGATGGVGRLASSASSVFRARGRLGANGPVPRSHSLSYRDGKKEGSASIRFSKGQVVSTKETPPPTPRKDRVPVPKGARAGAVDPTSALIVPAAAKADIAAVCARKLKIFDARNLFTLTMRPSRTIRLADGTRAHICAAAYKAIGGHRASSKAVKRFERNRSLSITYAPIVQGGDTTVWGIVGFRAKTRFGTARGEAKGVDAV